MPKVKARGKVKHFDYSAKGMKAAEEARKEEKAKGKKKGK